ncbi:MAG: nuclear transport factor 2 family protein [Kibdelosporangium sp.]
MSTEFFAAFNDAGALADTFTEDGVLTDDGGTFRGRDEIREWAEANVVNVKATVTGFQDQVITASVAGDFPGSPLSFDFAFVTSDSGHIRRLDITPSE